MYGFVCVYHQVRCVYKIECVRERERERETDRQRVTEGQKDWESERYWLTQRVIGREKEREYKQIERVKERNPEFRDRWNLYKSNRKHVRLVGSKTESMRERESYRSLFASELCYLKRERKSLLESNSCCVASPNKIAYKPTFISTSKEKPIST